MLVEAAAIGAREVECGVLEGLDGGPPEASVLGEIRLDMDSAHDFYDFEAKYVDGSADLDAPANVPDDVSDQLRGWAVAAFDAIGGEGLARVDFFLLAGGHHGRQRDQHDARLHADVDVPAGVGRDRARLPRARRPARHCRSPRTGLR